MNQIYQRIETQLAQFENPAGSSVAVKQLQFRLAMLSGKFTRAEQILLELKTHHSGLIEVLTDQRKNRQGNSAIVSAY